MPVARSTGHRLRSGIYVPSDVGTGYAISALAVQSDQGSLPWVIDASGTTPPKSARVVTNADLSVSEDGFLDWAWRMSYMTNAMLAHWLTTFLPGGVQSKDVTAMTYDATDTAMFIQGLIKRPEFPGPDAQYAIGGWANVIWRFSRGVQAFP